MRRASVLGAPIAHSLSPRLQGYWLKEHGIDGEYTALETTAAQLPETLKRLAGEGFAGCNLTLPLKEHALALMDNCDASALAAGAVNTIVFADGKMTGYNSDGFGFMESLKAAQPDWQRDHVAILGAGGAARAIAAALKAEGVGRFTIINRTAEKATRMISDLKIAGEVATRLPEDATLLINATSLGMTGQPPLEINISALPKLATVCDIVYRPLETPLLKAAKARGLATVEGLPMLLHQGRLGFRLWFGRDPAVTRGLYGEIASCAR